MIQCDQCDGSGWVQTAGLDGQRTGAVRECECRRVIKLEKMLERAGLPRRYQEASFETFDAGAADRSVQAAKLVSEKYCEEYLTDPSRGLLYVGSVGVGKTHLAIATLRRLTLDYSVRCYFADFRDLLKRLQASFDGGAMTRTEIMKPVMQSDVLVLDELGAARPTDWTFEIAEEIINNRYNEAKATLFTSNLPNEPPIGETRRLEPAGTRYGSISGAAADAMRGESLGDRLGSRMFSRVQQMCRVVPMAGDDYRRKAR